MYALPPPHESFEPTIQFRPDAHGGGQLLCVLLAREVAAREADLLDAGQHRALQEPAAGEIARELHTAGASHQGELRAAGGVDPVQLHEPVEEPEGHSRSGHVAYYVAEGPVL